jgi:hypothetical protein
MKLKKEIPVHKLKKKDFKKWRFPNLSSSTKSHSIPYRENHVLLVFKLRRYLTLIVH